MLRKAEALLATRRHEPIFSSCAHDKQPKDLVLSGSLAFCKRVDIRDPFWEGFEGASLDLVNGGMQMGTLGLPGPQQTKAAGLSRVP